MVDGELRRLGLRVLRAVLLQEVWRRAGGDVLEGDLEMGIELSAAQARIGSLEGLL